MVCIESPTHTQNVFGLFAREKTRTFAAHLSSFVHLRREAGLAVVELLGRDRPLLLLLLLHLLLLVLVQQELRLEAVAAAVRVAAVAARGLRSPGRHWRQHHWRAIHLTPRTNAPNRTYHYYSYV